MAARETYEDRNIVRMFQATQTIAIIGASPDPRRHSHRVMQYMQHNGFRVIPINPVTAEAEILGVPVCAGLADAPGPIDLVDVFRRADALPAVVDDVIAQKDAKAIRFLWFQLDLYDEPAARKARKAGIEVVMDRCLKVEYGRLLAHRG